MASCEVEKGTGPLPLCCRPQWESNRFWYHPAWYLLEVDRRGQFKRDIREYLALSHPLCTMRTVMEKLVCLGPLCVSLKTLLPLYTATAWIFVVEVVV